MKICTVCKHEKHSSEFYNNPLTKDGLGSQCKECDTSERKKITRKKKEILIEMLGGKCMTCGYNKCIQALDFHHKGDKNFNISQRLRHSIETLKKEIVKCDLLCSNCHRELHADENA